MKTNAINFNNCNMYIPNEQDINLECGNISLEKKSVFIVKEKDKAMFAAAPKMLEILKELNESIYENTDVEFQYYAKSLISRMKKIIKKASN